MHLKLIKTATQEAHFAADQEALYRKIRWVAMDLLARREHSRKELQSKLCQRYADSSNLIDEVIQGLAKENLQSDHRFAEAYVAMRKRKGYGPLRIFIELNDRGVSRDLIHSELDNGQINWFDEAVLVWKKKAAHASSDPVSNLKEKARLIRFMQYRGFTQEQIEEAVISYQCQSQSGVF